MREHSVWIFNRFTERWDLIAAYTSGVRDAIDCARAYKDRHPTHTLKVVFPGGTYTIWR